MPQVGPATAHYAVAGVAVLHGDPACEDGFAGIAIKTQEQSWTLGIANRSQIGVGEAYTIWHKGKVYVRSSLISAPAVGDPLFIAEATNALTKATAAGLFPFGKIDAVAGGNRGVPTGYVSVDMDARDAI
jgi:hypothetical protein